MLKTCSPLDKLLMINSLKKQIELDIEEYWDGIITDKNKILVNRDEATSIMLFIIAKTEIPDLTSQIKLIQEFTSYEIQSGNDGQPITKAYIMLTQPIYWISSIDGSKLQDKSYLLRATMQIQEQSIRYDKITLQDKNDKYDPFSVGGSYTLRNSYIGGGALNSSHNKTFEHISQKSFVIY
eukprot:403348685